jgi:hypothetical protein
MTAQELHDLTAPLFAKHPSADIGYLRYNAEDMEWQDFSGMTHVGTVDAMTGHLAKWLAEKVNEERQDLEIEVYKGKWFVKWEPDGYHSGDTFLHALFASCMKVEQ